MFIDGIASLGITCVCVTEMLYTENCSSHNKAYVVAVVFAVELKRRFILTTADFNSSNHRHTSLIDESSALFPDYPVITAELVTSDDLAAAELFIAGC